MEILLYSLFAVFCGVSLIGIICYFPRIKCWFYAFGHQEKLHNPKKNRLAVIVPAKNESESITPFFDSVERQSYDRALFDVYVVVDDPADPTIAMTEQRGHAPVIVSGGESYVKYVFHTHNLCYFKHFRPFNVIFYREAYYIPKNERRKNEKNTLFSHYINASHDSIRLP